LGNLLIIHLLRGWSALGFLVGSILGMLGGFEHRLICGFSQGIQLFNCSSFALGKIDAITISLVWFLFLRWAFYGFWLLGTVRNRKSEFICSFAVFSIWSGFRFFRALNRLLKNLVIFKEKSRYWFQCLKKMCLLRNRRRQVVLSFVCGSDRISNTALMTVYRWLYISFFLIFERQYIRSSRDFISPYKRR